MKKLWVILAVVLVFSAGGYWWFKQRQSAADAAAMQAAAQAAPVRAGAGVTAEGRVVPLQHAALSFATGGLVTEVLVKEGDQVQSGQVLARLHAARQAAALAQAQAELRRGEARLAELKAGPRPPDVAAAQAAVAAAAARLAKVEQGATTAEIATAEAEVYRAQARLAAEQSRPEPSLRDLEAARAGLLAARSQLDRLRDGPPAEDVAAAAAEVRRAQAQLDLTLAGARAEAIATAAADLAAGQPALQQAQAALAETELRAPFAGTVAVLDLKAGQYVTPGTPVARVADLSAWQIETEDLTELNVVRVAAGAAATITLDAIPGLELPGRVMRVKPMGEKRQGDMTYTVLIQPERSDQRLRWNMTAAVTFSGE